MLKAEGSYILPENVPANEFLNLENDKISTSRNWAVWLHEYLVDFPGKQDVPVKVLSVQSQFSLGVNGIKEFTAMQVERNLKNDTSVFYMGKEYENLLDFKTSEPDTERVARLVDYRNHL